MKQKVLTVTIDDSEEMYEAASEVVRMLKEGYTSGYSPNWTLSEEES